MRREDALALVDVPVEDLCARARSLRRDTLVTYSPKVFVPLTKLCRDVCHYCTFARPPRRGERAYLSLDDVLAIARAGAAAGCHEALFTLGDKPELRYRAAREELAALGCETTLEYLALAARTVLEETGLLPHLNPGVMSREDMAALRPVAASMGLMLETTAERLSERGGPHFGSPDKEPGRRLATIAGAGELAIPFTTGILIGIGETRAERIDALLAVRELGERHGHVQEVIVQNFRAKPATRMAAHPEPPLDELLWTAAAARAVLGPDAHVQCPPNLSYDDFPRLLDAGIDDWGGISPVTVDHVNPEAPWPEIERLAEATRSRGFELAPRLAVYPEYVADLDRWADPAVAAAIRRRSDALGLAREDSWSPGETVAIPARFRDPPDAVSDTASKASRVVHSHGVHGPIPHGERDADDRIAAGSSPPGTTVAISARLRHASDATGRTSVSDTDVKAQRTIHRRVARDPLPLDSRDELGEAELVRLFRARGHERDRVLAAADRLRRETNGDEVTYVVNRNVQYTNVCYFRCGFCAFSKGRLAANLRGAPYLLPLDEIVRRAREAWTRGATEVCLQGGIHPAFTGQTYLDVVRAIKDAVPAIHVHAFSALEIWQGAATLGEPLDGYLEALRAAGLGSLPGTAAEILDDDVRRVICPDKVTTSQWLDVHATAHRAGLRSNVTMMFGHVEAPRHWARHLIRARHQQRETGGFTEFVPLPFVHMEAPMYLRGRARRGPTFGEGLLVHAVARLALHPWITNVQASWVKLGPDGVRALLAAGVNDLGGTLMNESISRAAGAAHGQELGPERMEELIRAAGRAPRQRTTLYGDVPEERRRASFGAAPLAPTREPHVSEAGLVAPPRLLRPARLDRALARA